MIISKILGIAEKYPDKIAVITGTGQYTYKELANKMKKAADIINNLQLREREPLAIVMPNCIEFIVFLCAAEQTGHCAVLLSDKFKMAELNYHLESSDIRYIIYKDSIKCRELPLSDYNALYYPGDYICQITSGTNGTAKGVVRTSSAVMLEIEETVECVRMSHKDIFLTMPPIYHSFGLIAGTLAPLCIGATLVLKENFVVAEVIKAIEMYKITILFAVPFMYQMLCDTRGLKSRSLMSLRICFSAGAPLPEELFQKFWKISGIYITQDYGSTETGVMCINTEPHLHSKATGKPVGSRSFRVINDKGEDCPAGENGKLITKSNCDAVRYLYPKEFNSQFSKGWICLGDYGCLGTDGYLYVQGRMAHMINVAGMKVDPEEVERVITEIPGVKEAVVIGKPAKPYGEVVKAVIVASESVSVRDVIEYCRSKMADYKVPKVVEMFDCIPKSPTGKIQRKYLI